MADAEILFLGNELLIGRTLNTNGQFISKELTSMGFKVTRSTTVRDDKTQIIQVLKEIRERKPRILIIGGGLGPTFDDIQLDTISEALNRPLTNNTDAYKLLIQRYGDENKISKARKKMAMLPENSIPLRNSVGSAPGVRTIVDNNDWFSVPGVPSEMKAIITEEIRPIIKNYVNYNSVGFAFDVYNTGESQVLEILDKVRMKYEKIEFKTHPNKNDNEYFLTMNVYGFTDEKYARTAIDEWRELLIAEGRTCSEIKNIYD